MWLPRTPASIYLGLPALDRALSPSSATIAQPQQPSAPSSFGFASPFHHRLSPNIIPNFAFATAVKLKQHLFYLLRHHDHTSHHDILYHEAHQEGQRPRLLPARCSAGDRSLSWL
ncbi:hypothetical protein B0T16DRAFT_492214 [Cercophora newfieldiana]|uniref:Uncharacterized protein n=1 Tax=Cercophora newfieldiana TaxID=92897 RepID=A0AA40CT16_9PEZI|nr:hypothetical protein B0T16DRAFT_492214 [Cercophora newfieldiana]